MADKRQLLSCLSEGLSSVVVPGLPHIPVRDIHRSHLDSVKLGAQQSSAPCFQSMLLPVLCPFHCPGGGQCPKGCPGSALPCLG